MTHPEVGFVPSSLNLIIINEQLSIQIIKISFNSTTNPYIHEYLLQLSNYTISNLLLYLIYETTPVCTVKLI